MNDLMDNLILTKTEMTRYSARMRPVLIAICAIIAVLAMLAFIALLFFAPTPAKAKNAVLPPPTVEEADVTDDHYTGVGERAPDLNKQLKSPDQNSNVDIRSYKRKDGAQVTEYSLHGQIYEIKVQPTGGLPAYYLYRNKAGHLERRRPGGQPMVTPPSWILQKF